MEQLHLFVKTSLKQFQFNSHCWRIQCIIQFRFTPIKRWRNIPLSGYKCVLSGITHSIKSIYSSYSTKHAPNKVHYLRCRTGLTTLSTTKAQFLSNTATTWFRLNLQSRVGASFGWNKFLTGYLLTLSKWQQNISLSRELVRNPRM